MDAAAKQTATRVAPQTGRRRISVLGATGSIGRNTAEILAANPDRFEVVALVANKDAARLAEQAIALGAHIAVVADETAREELEGPLAGTGIETAAGRTAVIEAACQPVDMVMAAIVGVAGLEPTIAAVHGGADIALANKECLVSAGPYFMGEAARNDISVIPIDSEHSAIFQILSEGRDAALGKILLTASGGPFRTWDRTAMEAVTPEQALRHPNWDMGQKITIDSATMMNKGLELIEARHLFDLAEEKIEIVVHPQSIVHGMAEFVDGSVLAQMGPPDMRTPIAVGLAWPERLPVRAERLDLVKLGQLTFEAPDEERFPALAIARAALREGASATATLNAANEVAVAAFLAGRIGFMDIPAVIEATLDAGSGNNETASLDEILAIDLDARRRAGDAVAKRQRS